MTKQLGLWCPDRDGGTHHYLIEGRRARRIDSPSRVEWELKYLCACGERFTTIEWRRG